MTQDWQTTKKSYLKWTSKLSVDKYLIAIHKIKTNLAFNKPTYAGMCILELSKLPMYTIMITLKKYVNKSRLLFTDTDNLMHEIKLKMFMAILIRIKKTH